MVRPKDPVMSDDMNELNKSVERLTNELAILNAHRFVRVHNKPWKLILFQFSRGLAFGLGSVVGATFLVSLAAWWLSQFEFLPVIGEWARTIADEIAQDR